LLAQERMGERSKIRIETDLESANGSVKVAKPAGAGRVQCRESGITGRSARILPSKPSSGGLGERGETDRRKSDQGLDATGLIG
jgi:hypothetical protein